MLSISSNLPAEEGGSCISLMQDQVANLKLKNVHAVFLSSAQVD